MRPHSLPTSLGSNRVRRNISRRCHLSPGLSPRIKLYVPAFLPSLLFALVFAAPAGAQRGAMTAPRNLAELVDEAGVIVRGQILSAKVEPHPDFPALWTVLVTLRVEESLKGQPVSTYTFRQFIWDERDREEAGRSPAWSTR